jgi:hypothetical protein
VLRDAICIDARRILIVSRMGRPADENSTASLIASGLVQLGRQGFSSGRLTSETPSA